MSLTRRPSTASRAFLLGRGRRAGGFRLLVLILLLLLLLLYMHHHPPELSRVELTLRLARHSVI